MENQPVNPDLARLERQIYNLTKLVEINSIINSTLDIGRLLTIIMEIIKDIMEAEASTLLLYEEKSQELVFKVALGEAGKDLLERYRVKMGQGLAGWVAETRKPLAINDVYNDRRFDPDFDRQTGFTTRAMLCTPLLFKGKLLGVIQAINPINRPEFREDDLQLFKVFGNQAALAVQNAIYFQHALEEERIRSELEAAGAIQALLTPELDQVFDSFRIAMRSVTAREIGGEFHSLYRLDASHIGIALGDLHEKGVPGGLNASIFSGGLRALAAVGGKNPTLLVRTLSRAMASEIPSARYVSIFYGVLDTENREFTFLNAGVAYPILVRDGVARYLRFGKRSLRADVSQSKSVVVKFKRGDCFVIMSDGMLRVKNRLGRQMGLRRLMDHLQGAFPGPREVIDSLIALCVEYAGDVGIREDISAVVITVA